MLAETVKSWPKEWLAQGRAEGRVEGRAEGRVEGRTEGKVEGSLRVTGFPSSTSADYEAWSFLRNSTARLKRPSITSS